LNKDEIFKVHLLQEQSVRVLCQKRLEKYLLERSVVNEIEQEWKNIKTCIYKAAEESLGKKFKRKNPKSLKIWNEEIETAIQEKKKAYLIYLQKRTPSTEEKYKEKRNIAKKVVRQANQQSWEKFISE
jgi:hypothetical protein